MPPSPPSSSLCSEARPPKLSKLPSNWFIGEYPSEHQQATINSYLLPERWPWESFSSSPVSSARHIKSKKSSGSISYVLRYAAISVWLSVFPGPQTNLTSPHPISTRKEPFFWFPSELLQPDPSTRLEAPKLSWAPEMVRGRACRSPFVGQQGSRPRKSRALHHWQAFPQFNSKHFKHAAHRKDFRRFLPILWYDIHNHSICEYVHRCKYVCIVPCYSKSKKMHHPAKRLTGVDAKSGNRRITHRATQISANPSTSSSSCKTLPANKYNVSVSNTISLMVWFHVIPIISPNPPPFPVLQQFARSLHSRGTPTLQHLGLLSPRWILVKKNWWKSKMPSKPGKP